MADLRARLRAISSTAEKPKKRESPGLVIREWKTEAPVGIYDLPAPALRRIGYNHGIFDPGRCLFLDTETTGLSGGAGTVAFLVGVGYLSGSEFVVRQYMMRDYPDEPMLLDMVARHFEGRDILVTYNGRTFDAPLLESRYIMNRMQDRWKKFHHIDLLYPSRAAWKMRIGKCNLGNIESEILGTPRSGDIPGSEVPERFFEFLKSGDLSLLEPVIDHNRQDIATLATLLVRLANVYAAPGEQKSRQDIFSIGKALERQGELRNAKELYRLAAVPPARSLIRRTDTLSSEAAWRLYLLLRREGDVPGMEAQLERMIRRRMMGCAPYIELAKLLEHRKKDPARALRVALVAEQMPDTSDTDDIDKRIARLRKKAQQNGGRT